MPERTRYNVGTDLFGKDCVFGIIDWRGFIANAAKENAVITGTLNEVATPYGTGLQVGVANSYVTFNWTGRVPLTTSPRSIFTRFYLNSIASQQAIMAWGTAVLRNMTYMRVYPPGAINWRAGLYDDDEWGGDAPIVGWHSFGLSNAGINGGSNLVWVDGSTINSGTNAGNGVTTTSALYLFRLSSGIEQCSVGTILQTILVFNRVIDPAEFLDLHNRAVYNKL